MKISAFSEKDYPRVLDIYGNSKLDELRFENDEKRLSALKESDIYIYHQGFLI